MSILVTGANGTVGAYFKELAPTFSEPLELTDVDSLDVTNLDALRERFSRKKYSTVIHLAAATDVDRCEKDPEYAYALNALSAWNVALSAREAGCDMVQVSTTAVFGADGSEGPFCELDVPNPPNVYAKTKLEGEKHVERLLPSSFVLRTAWIMGGGKADKKFVGKVAEKLLKGEPIKAVNDEFGSPTYARDFVVAVREILKTRAYGLYHVTGQGRASRYDMALEMKKILGSKSEIEPVSAKSFDLPARRSRSDASFSRALPARGLGHLMPTWQDGLKRYLLSWCK